MKGAGRATLGQEGVGEGAHEKKVAIRRQESEDLVCGGNQSFSSEKNRCWAVLTPGTGESGLEDPQRRGVR